MDRLREVSNTERFTGKAEAYDHSRPAYPVEALACVREQCHLAPGAAVIGPVSA